GCRRGCTSGSGERSAEYEGDRVHAMSASEDMQKPCVVLLSGGLDSTTCLAWARAQGYDCHTLAIDYGQRHAIEVEAAQRVAAALGVRDHRVVRVELRAIGGSALTADLPV